MNRNSAAFEVCFVRRAATGEHPAVAVLLAAAARFLETSKQWPQSTWAPGLQFNRLYGIALRINGHGGFDGDDKQRVRFGT